MALDAEHESGDGDGAELKADMSSTSASSPLPIMSLSRVSAFSAHAAIEDSTASPFFSQPSPTFVIHKDGRERFMF